MAFRALTFTRSVSAVVRRLPRAADSLRRSRARADAAEMASATCLNRFSLASAARCNASPKALALLTARSFSSFHLSINSEIPCAASSQMPPVRKVFAMLPTAPLTPPNVRPSCVAALPMSTHLSRETASPLFNSWSASSCFETRKRKLIVPPAMTTPCLPSTSFIWSKAFVSWSASLATNSVSSMQRRIASPASAPLAGVLPLRLKSLMSDAPFAQYETMTAAAVVAAPIEPTPTFMSPGRYSPGNVTR